MKHFHPDQPISQTMQYEMTKDDSLINSKENGDDNDVDDDDSRTCTASEESDESRPGDGPEKDGCSQSDPSPWTLAANGTDCLYDSRANARSMKSNQHQNQQRQELQHPRDVCDPKFASWCDDSSTEEEEEEEEEEEDNNDDDDNDDDDESVTTFDSNDNIVVDFSSLGYNNTQTFTSFYYSCRVAAPTPTPTTITTPSNNNNRDERVEDEGESKIRITQQRCRDEELFLDNLKRRKLRFSPRPSVREFAPAPFSCHNDMYYSCHQLQKMMDAYHSGREFRLEEENYDNEEE